MSPWWRGRWYRTRTELVAGILAHVDAPDEDTGDAGVARADAGRCWRDECDRPALDDLGLCRQHRDDLTG